MAFVADFGTQNFHLKTKFNMENNDAENFYVSKNGVDNGYNGYNGEFFKTLTSAINFLKSN